MFYLFLISQHLLDVPAHCLAQTELQLVQSNPQIHGGHKGLYQAYRKMYEALGVNNIDGYTCHLLHLLLQLNPAKENQNGVDGCSIASVPRARASRHILKRIWLLCLLLLWSLIPQLLWRCKGHIQEHIGLDGRSAGSAGRIMSQIPPEQMQMMQQQAQMMPPQPGQPPADPMMQFKPQMSALAAEKIIAR